MTLPKELRDKAEAASLTQHIYEPKYGGKDHSGYETLMKYEVNYDREEAFMTGVEWLYGELMPKLKELKEANKRISELEDQVLDLDRFDL